VFASKINFDFVEKNTEKMCKKNERTGYDNDAFCWKINLVSSEWKFVFFRRKQTHWFLQRAFQKFQSKTRNSDFSSLNSLESGCSKSDILVSVIIDISKHVENYY
jgi:hypothetical protein